MLIKTNTLLYVFDATFLESMFLLLVIYIIVISKLTYMPRIFCLKARMQCDLCKKGKFVFSGNVHFYLGWPQLRVVEKNRLKAF